MEAAAGELRAPRGVKAIAATSRLHNAADPGQVGGDVRVEGRALPVGVGVDPVGSVVAHEGTPGVALREGEERGTAKNRWGGTEFSKGRSGSASSAAQSTAPCPAGRTDPGGSHHTDLIGNPIAVAGGAQDVLGEAGVDGEAVPFFFDGDVGLTEGSVGGCVPPPGDAAHRPPRNPHVWEGDGPHAVIHDGFALQLGGGKHRKGCFAFRCSVTVAAHPLPAPPAPPARPVVPAAGGCRAPARASCTSGGSGTSAPGASASSPPPSGCRGLRG